MFPLSTGLPLASFVAALAALILLTWRFGWTGFIGVFATLAAIGVSLRIGEAVAGARRRRALAVNGISSRGMG